MPTLPRTTTSTAIVAIGTIVLLILSAAEALGADSAPAAEPEGVPSWLLTGSPSAVLGGALAWAVRRYEREAERHAAEREAMRATITDLSHRIIRQEERVVAVSALLQRALDT
jgi:hypothetical protein